MYLAQYNNGYNMMGGGDWGWGIFMMVFWAVVIIAIVFLVIRGISANPGNKSKDEDSLTIAKNRYAKGEITKKEYEQLKKDLSS